jgi:hypothetical protein
LSEIILLLQLSDASEWGGLLRLLKCLQPAQLHLSKARYLDRFLNVLHLWQVKTGVHLGRCMKFFLNFGEGLGIRKKRTLGSANSKI